jgi:hemoglobin-like flavoprotein
MSGKVCLAQYEGHLFIVLSAMTPVQVRIVQESFKQIAPYTPDAARIFYDELFRIAPGSRYLFPDDMREQKAKLVQMLAFVVKSLANVATISEHIADLGRRHASYDVTDQHYAYVGEALLLMLRRMLGSRYTEDVHDAWSAAYTMLARMMREAAETAHLPSGFFGHVVRDVVTSRYGITEATGRPTSTAVLRPMTDSIAKRRSV